jgi:uncharacterized protein (TIGR00369 family)
MNDNAPSSFPTPTLRHRRFAWSDPLAMAERRRAMTGLDFFRAVAAGDLPQPPLYEALDFRIVEAAPGRARFESRLAEFQYNPLGTVHGGFAATMLDSACGVAVQSEQPVGRIPATARLRLDFLRPMTAATGTVICSARTLRAGRNLCWSAGEIVDADGRVLARGDGRFVVSEIGAAPPPRPEHRPVAGARDHAWPPVETYLAAERAGSGLDFMHAMIAGTLPQAPIHALLGVSLAEAEPGRAVYVCTPDSFHYNPMGGVHGGLMALMIDSAGGAAAQSTMAKGFSTTAINLTVDYFRPLGRATGPVRCEGKVRRAGRQIVLIDCALTDRAGNLLARGWTNYLVFAPKAAA